MKYLNLFLLSIIFYSKSISQTVTLECYYQDTINNSDCIICNKPADREVFTGLIANYTSPAKRIKIYFPYQIKVRDNDVLIYDNYNHQAFFSLLNTPQFSTREQLQEWLRHCHYQQRITQYYISGDSIYVQITGDSIRSVKLPSGFMDHDEQKIDTVYFVMDSLHIKIQNDPRTWVVYINTSGAAGADKQRIDTFRIVNDTLQHSLQRDSVPYSFVDLKPYKDNTDSQSIYIPHIDSLGIRRMGSPPSVVFIDENQYLDTFDIVNDTIRGSIFGDRQRYKSISLKPYLFGASFDALDDAFAPYSLTNGFMFDFQGINGITAKLSSSGSNILNIDGSKLQWLAAASSGTPALIGDASTSETVTFVGTGRTTTNISGNTIFINTTEIDSSITNELQSPSWTGITSSSANLTLSLNNSSTTLTVSGLSISGNASNITISNTYSYSWLLDANDDAFGATTISNGNTVNVQGINGIRAILPSSGSNNMRIDGAALQWQLQANGSGATTYTISDRTSPNQEKIYIKGTGIVTTSLIGTSLDGSTDTLQINAVEQDSSITNEIQVIDTFIKIGDTVKISLSKDGQMYKFIIIKDKSVDSTWYIPAKDSLYIRVKNDSIYRAYIQHDRDSQLISIRNDTIFLTNGGFVKLPPQIVSGDNYVDTVYFNSGTRVLTVGRTGTLPDLTAIIPDVDNYVNSFTFNNLTRLLAIGQTGSVGNFSVTIPDSDNQVLSWQNILSTSAQLNISNTGNTINLIAGAGIQYSGTSTLTISAKDTSATNELQNLNTVSLITSLTNSTTSIQFIPSGSITITQGGTAANATYTIGSTFSETPQNLGWGTITSTLANQTISLGTGNTFTAGNGIAFSGTTSLIISAKDTSLTNEAQTLTNTGTTSVTQTLSNVNGVGGGFTQWLTSTGISLNHVSNVVTLSVVDQSATNEVQTLTNTGTSSVTSTLNQILGVGGGFITHQTTAGISLSHVANVVTWSVVDQSATNEAQSWIGSGTSVYTGNLSNVSGVGGGKLIIRTGTGLSLTHNLDTVTLVNTLPHVGDADWFTSGTTTPPLSISDSMYHMGRTGIGIQFPLWMLDVSTDARIAGHHIGTGPTNNTNTIRFGQDALKVNTGTFNTAIGAFALINNIGGSSNMAIGNQAVSSNVTASLLLGIGNNALLSTVAQDNVGVGHDVLFSNINGQFNTAIGHGAISNNTNGSENVGIGDLVLLTDTASNRNTSIGRYSMKNVKNSINNVSIGVESLQGFNTAITNFQRNIAIGARSMANVSSNITDVIAIGYQAGLTLIGSDNIIIGNNSGANINGTKNLFIGSNNDMTGTHNGNVVIGYGQTIVKDSTIQLYNGFGQLGFYMNGSGNIGLAHNNPTQKVHIKGNLRMEGAIFDSTNVSGVRGQFLMSTGLNTGVKWVDVTAKDTSNLNEIQGEYPYVLSGDTVGFLLAKLNLSGLLVYDTIVFKGDTSGIGSIGGGSGTCNCVDTAQVFNHTSGTGFSLSTLSRNGGSIKLIQGTQIQVLPTISTINLTDTIKVDFNGCQTCIGYFGSSTGFTNDSIQTDTSFRYYTNSRGKTLRVPYLELPTTNTSTNPTQLYLSNNGQVQISGLETNTYTNTNFHHRITANTTLSLPSGNTSPSVHYFHNDGFTLTLNRSGTETIDGLTTQSFSSTDNKLIILTNDGAGHWYTNKVTASGGTSPDINYNWSATQFMTSTTLTDITGSTSATIPAGNYMVRVAIRASSFSLTEGFTFALNGTGVSVNYGSWTLPTNCTGSVLVLDAPGLGSSATTSTGCDTGRMITGQFFISSSGGTIKIQGAAKVNAHDMNVFGGTVEIHKI